MSKWNAAVYLRLSSDDRDKMESNSITNQRELISKFVELYKDIKIFNYYMDDGYTGTDFNRPGYQKMLKDIRDRNVNTIIIKDLSRIGRNYIEVGNFIDDIIPLYNLRFISINDNVDSYLKPESMKSLEIPFKNLINESYAKDISNKVRSSFNVMKQNGEYIGVVAPYGYFKSEENCHKLLIDPEAAKIVKRIYDMALKGLSRQEIAKELNRLHIPTPSAYIKNKYHYKGLRESKEWSTRAVDKILKNEDYIGNLVQGKNTRISHKNHNVIRKSEDSWIRVEDTHDAIIDKDTFELINDNLYKRNNQVNKKGKLNVYSGHIKCADCGASLSRSSRGRDGYAFYVCSSYKYKKECSKHYIPENKLNNLVLTVFNQYINVVCNIDEKIHEVLDGSEKKYNTELIKIKSVEIKKEISKYENLLSDLVNDYKDDLITKDEMESYNREYLYKLNELRIEENDLEKGNDINLDWINKFKNQKQIDVIDRNIIMNFIDNIYVDDNCNIKIVFRNNDEYIEAIKFLKTHNCVI